MTNPYLAAIAGAQLALQADAVVSVVIGVRDSLQRGGFTRAQANRMTTHMMTGAANAETVDTALIHAILDEAGVE